MDQIYLFYSGLSGIFSPLLIEKFWIFLLLFGLILSEHSVILLRIDPPGWENLFCLVLTGNVWFEQKSIPFVRRNYFEILR